MYYDDENFEKTMKGRIIQGIVKSKTGDEIVFTLKGGGVYKLYHQDD